MSSLQWHSILPSGAVSPSSLPEDLAPALEQSNYFGKKNILLAPETFDWNRLPWVKEKISQRAIIPQRYITLDEFSLSDGIAERISQESHLAVIIDREPSAAAIERMISTRSWLDGLSYIVMGRKDWRFKDTFRALPHFIRPRLFLDFPVSLHPSDPFYAPSELAAILVELKSSCGLESIRSFCPHFHLRKELLGANVIALSAPAEASEGAELSIVAPDPDTVNQLGSSGLLQKLGRRIEIVVPRVIGQEAKTIRSIEGVAVSHVWLHLEDPARHYPEIQAHLRNWGARHSSGKSILFADAETRDRLDTILDRLLLQGQPERAILRSGLGILVDSAGFKEAGGFDPLYSSLGLGDPEFLYRYLGGFCPEGVDFELAKYLRERFRGSHGGLGLGLFYHQYFDLPFIRYFQSSPSGANLAREEEERNSHLRNQFRYRMEQSRDAYISLYRASPKVAFYGNIQLLLKPYHWVRPHVWRLKMPAYPLLVKPSHWIYRNGVQGFHWLKARVWRLKMPAYPLLVKPSHWIYRNGVQGFHWLKARVWRLKMLVVGPYHFIRQHIWKLKLAFYFVTSNLWRVKQVYYVFFRLLFPVRKIYYFCAYQYEKRILGLYGKQHLWIQK